MKRRAVLALGALAAGTGILGAGAGICTFRLHRTPQTFPKLTKTHLADVRARSNAATGAAPKILFVGNSNTLRGDIPELVGALAAEQGWPLWTATAAANGARLIETARLSQYREALRAVPWDALVLQDSSRTALRACDRSGSSLAMRYMAALAPTAKVILFPAWPGAPGHPIYTGQGGYLEERVDNPAALARRIEQFHRSLATAQNFTLAPVVLRWMAAAADGAQLYAADLHHANASGAALVAGVLLETLQAVFDTGHGAPVRP